MTAGPAAAPSAGTCAWPARAHAVASHRGVEIDVSAIPAPDRAHSRLVILLRHGGTRDPRVVEYVIDDGDPRSALDAGLELGRAAIETAPLRPG